MQQDSAPSHIARNYIAYLQCENVAYIKGKGKSQRRFVIAPRRENLTSKAPRCGSHIFTCKHTTPAFTA